MISIFIKNFMTHHLKTAVAGIGLLVFLFIPFPVFGKNTKGNLTEKQKQPYNILWLDGDDLSINLACYGDNSVSTPNIDRLANEGIVYDNFFVTNGQCSPVRASLHTGMYPTTIGAHHMRSNAFMIDPEDASTKIAFEPVLPVNVKVFTEYLREKDYFCVIQNKLDYQYGDALTAWDIATSPPWGPAPSSNILPLGNDEAEKTADNYEGLWNRRAKGQPFFAHVTFDHTHERYIWDRSCPADNPLQLLNRATASFNAGEIPDDVDIDKVMIPPYFPDDPVIRADIARYYHQVMALDRDIGRVLEQLEKEGDLDNTVIILFGDNGRAFPREKRWQWDSGLRVPLIIRWPDKRSAGSHVKELVSAVDLAPTTLSLAEVDVPDHMQGRVFLGGNRDAERKYVYGHKDRSDTHYDKIRSIRSKKFHYIRNYYPEIPYSVYSPFAEVGALFRQCKNLATNFPEKLNAEQLAFWTKTKPAEELYGIISDPYELTNLANDPYYNSIKYELSSELDMWINKTDIWADPTGTKTPAGRRN